MYPRRSMQVHAKRRCSERKPRSKRCVFKRSEIVIGKDRPACEQDDTEHKQECGKYPPDAARVKIGEAETAVVQVVQNDAGDQKSGDDEKNIDADEPAVQRAGLGVGNHDAEHGDGAQAVYVRPVLRRPLRERPLWHVSDRKGDGAAAQD
jgi:hypothetical protein